MNRWTVLGMATMLCCFVALGCSGSDPLTPAMKSQTTAAATPGLQCQTHLWGYYEVRIDIPSGTAIANLNRSMMFSANVVQFINSNPTNLKFQINDTSVGASYVDVDIDVTITHPFNGMSQYNGYDVRGIFIGDGSESLQFKDLNGGPDLTVETYRLYPEPSDQAMYDYNLSNPGKDPHEGPVGMPDGFTRWWNPTEFGTPGLFGYLPGKYASPGYHGKATLNPYKYFADGINPEDEVFKWLQETPDHGVFSSGSSATRNYYLRFPNSKGVKFNYAIVANWKSEKPIDHPANASEAVGCSVTVTPDIWYGDNVNKGGDLILDISLFDWDSNVDSTGVMEDYGIIIMSDVLSDNWSDPSLQAIGGGEHYATYHIEIPADNIKGTQNNEFWVIVEDKNLDYTNPNNVPNDAGTDNLTAFFRYDLYVSTEPYNLPPTCDLTVETPPPYTGWAPIMVKFNAGASDPDQEYTTLGYDWDFDGDGQYHVADGDIDDEWTGPDYEPTHGFNTAPVGPSYVKVTDDFGESVECCLDSPLAIDAHQSKNIDITKTGIPQDIAIDPITGDLIVIYDSGLVYRFDYSTYYTTSGSFSVNYGTYTRVDVGKPEDIHLAAWQVWNYIWRHTHWSSGGSYLNGNTESYWTYIEVVAIDPAGLNGVIMILKNSDSSYYYTWAWAWYGAGAYGYPWFYVQTQVPQGSPAGYDKLCGEYIRGGEGDKDANTLWFVEGTDCYAARFDFNLQYIGPYFGTGSPTDGSSGLNDPMDITRDNNNHYYVLDHLSGGGYTIKAFKYTTAPLQTTALGSFGDNSDWEYQPRRIEGSDFNGNVVVLNRDDTGNAKVSVFIPAEIPQ